MSAYACPTCGHDAPISEPCARCEQPPCCEHFGTSDCRCWEYDMMHGTHYQLWEKKILPLVEFARGLQARLRAGREALASKDAAISEYQAATQNVTEITQRALRTQEELAAARREVEEVRAKIDGLAQELEVSAISLESLNPDRLGRTAGVLSARKDVATRLRSIMKPLPQAPRSE